MNWNLHGPDAGPVMICLHGFMGDARDWDFFAQAFLNVLPGWRIAAPTLPGHADAPTVFTGEEIAGEVFGWMDACGIASAAIAGYSLGGRLALRLALDNPARFPVFVGISTTAGIDDAVEREARRVADEAVAARMRVFANRESFREFLEQWWELPVFGSPTSTPLHRAKFISSRLKKSPAALAEALLAWSPGVLPSGWGRLALYPGQALLICGEADLKFTALMERMRSTFRLAKSHMVSAAGHRLLEECAEEVAAVVARYLNEEQP